MSAVPTYAYRGRRWFQAVIGIIGLVIMTMSIYDMRQPQSFVIPQEQVDQGTKEQPLDQFNAFMRRYVSREAMYGFLIAIGGLIAYTGLNGAFWRGDQLRLAPEGMFYYRFGTQVIDWHEISYVNFRRRRRMGLIRTSLIEFQFKDWPKIARRQPPMYRLLRNLMQPFDAKTFSILGYDLEKPALTVLEQLGEHLNAAGVQPDSQSHDSQA